MDTIKAITEEVMRQMEMIKELQAEVKALKGEPSDPSPPVGEPLREIVNGALLQDFIKTKGRKD